MIDFKACLADVLIENDNVIISESLAIILGAGLGEQLSIAPGRVE